MNDTIDLTNLIQTIRACADQNESLRRLADPIADDIRSLRLGQLMLGRADGGLGLSLVAAMNIFEHLAREDASTAWVVWNSLLVCRFSRYMNEALRAEVFSDPHALFCQSTRPMGRARTMGDGVVASGRWNLVSGCHHGDWALLTCIRESTEESGTLVVAVPRSDFEIHDTWFSTGLQGSGSHDVVLDELHVHSDRCFEFGNPRKQAETLDQLPVMVSVASIFSAQILGVAQSTFDHVLNSARITTQPVASSLLSDRFDAQYEFALHQSALEAARVSLATAAANQWQLAEQQVSATPENVRKLYGASLFAMKCARDAMGDLDLLAGTAGIYKSSPVERKFRDQRVMLKHIVAQPSMYADTGRVLLGSEPTWPAYAT